MKAFLKNYRQSPRKVALVAELIKSKRVAEALIVLDNLPKRASLPIKKLLVSAIANAKNLGVSEENLVVENMLVNKGVVLKRIMPRARGSASRINKRTSHVEINLSEKKSDKKAKKTEPVVEEKTKAKEPKKEIVKKDIKSKKVSKKEVASK
jgi:large subunit ribosomal protein L22